MRRRVAGLCALELRLELRYGVHVVGAVLAVLWTAVLLAVPAPAARLAAPFVLFTDTATLGAFFMGALVLFERAEGTLGVLRTSPVRVREYLGTKLATLTALAVAAALPIAAAGARGQLRPAPIGSIGSVIAGVGLTSLLVLLAAFLVATGRRSLTGFMTTAPWILVPLLGVPLAHAAGLLTHPLAYAVPTTGTFDLIRAGLDTPARPSGWAVAYALAWIGTGTAAVGRRFARAAGAERSPFPQPAPRSHVRRRTTARSRPAPRPAGNVLAVFAGFARVDLRNIAREPLLYVVAAAPLLLAAVVRLGYPPAQRWLLQVYDFDLAPHRPLLLALIIVLHVPMMYGMAGALLVLDDADDRTLLVLRVTPVTLRRYLAYRLVSVTVASAAGLAVAVPLCGLVPPSSLGSLVPVLALAATLAPLMTLATAAAAGNRVTGIGVIKALGLPFYLPLAAWFLPVHVSWPLAVLPSYWAARGLWQATAGSFQPFTVAAGAGCVVLVGTWLWRRALARMGRG